MGGSTLFRPIPRTNSRRAKIPVLVASVAVAVGLLAPLGSALAVVMGDSGASTDNDDNSAVYQDGYRGAAGYLPIFHPRPLASSEATQARKKLYPATGGELPSPENISLEFPDQYQLSAACYGRGFDPRGPYAQPPQAPYLLPGNVAAMTFGPAMLPRGGVYIATSPTGFNDTVHGPSNLDPAAGPIVTQENTTGIYEVGL